MRIPITPAPSLAGLKAHTRASFGPRECLQEEGSWALINTGRRRDGTDWERGREGDRRSHQPVWLSSDSCQESIGT